MAPKIDGRQGTEQNLVAHLLALHGEVMSGEDLKRTLGYRSKRSYYRAIAEDRVPVKLFKLRGGRAWNARTQDVAEWLSRVGGLNEA
tara:strand:- start:1371 stop:1631 length:261 start_codon:yes stop_codon:yes gene_type:complete